MSTDSNYQLRREDSLKVATVFRFGLAAALLVAATRVGFADVKHVFVKGDVVSSAAMNENFADLDTRLSSPTRVATIGTVSYSVGVTKGCGAAPTRDGKFGPLGSGFTTAKTACENQCGSKSAHMCTSEEAARLAQMGSPISVGWVSTGIAVATPGPTGVSNDCTAWSNNVGQNPTTPFTQNFGTVWTGQFMGFVTCDVSEPIACCD
ncbi:MAG: hypothetical protein QOI41_5945 [Myxococcales bacterium]|nr:hypothetical protein [Myxococcales bacterium]